MLRALHNGGALELKFDVLAVQHRAQIPPELKAMGLIQAWKAATCAGAGDMPHTSMIARGKDLGLTTFMVSVGVTR